MKKIIQYHILLIVLTTTVLSCNKQPIQKIEESTTEVVTLEEEVEEKFEIENLYNDWVLIKENLESNYANFIGNRNVYVTFEKKSNEVVSTLYDTTSGDTTVLVYGYSLIDRLMTIYDLESKEFVTKNYIERLNDSLLITKVNYGSLVQEFELKYNKAKQPIK